LRSASPMTVTPGQYGQLPDGYLLFPASDHNQSVLIDYSFTLQVAPNQTRRISVSGELQPIRDATLDPTGPQTVLNFQSPNWFIRLNNSSKFGSADPLGRADI